jgi:hypothetical protein
LVSLDTYKKSSVVTLNSKLDSIYTEMAKFLDVHSFHSLGESAVKELQLSPPDEFGVKHLNILYNKANDLCFCYLEAPNRESVEKHHEKANLKCNWITEVETTA